MSHIADIRIALEEELLRRERQDAKLADLLSNVKARFSSAHPIVPAYTIDVLAKSVLSDLMKSGTVELLNGIVRLVSKPSAVWLEKTLIADRPDRTEGPYRLGSALWSPQRDRTGGDTYATMRKVRPGDLVLHLTDNARIIGVSKATSCASTDFRGIKGSEWADQPAYMISLSNYEECVPPFERAEFLGDPETQPQLLQIRAAHKNLFYDRRLKLLQGFYLTAVPEELAQVLNSTYEKRHGKPLPHFLPQRTSSLNELREPPSQFEDHFSPPPEIPDQGAGPRFALRKDGIVDFLRESDEAKPSDRLRALHNVAIETAKDLVHRLSGTNQQAALQALAGLYLVGLSCETEDLDFAYLYGIGLRLQVALEVAEREISNRLLPELEDPQLEALKSLTKIHGVFIQSNALGRQLLIDAERYELRREKLPELRAALTETGEKLLAAPDIVDPKAARFLLEMSKIVGWGSHPERPAAYTIAAYSNLAIVLAEIAAVTWLASQLGAAPVGFAGAAAMVLSRDRGKASLSFMREILADGEDTFDRKLKHVLGKISQKYVHFVLKNEKTLRRLASQSKTLGFIAVHLDWLREQQNR